MNNTFFGFIMELLFGKRWVVYTMKQNLRTRLLSDEMEIATVKSKGDQVRELLADAKEKLEHYEKEPLARAEDNLPEELREDKKAIYDENQKIEKERRGIITALKKDIKEYETNLNGEDGMLAQLYQQTLIHREKWDFLKNYEIKSTYADKK